MISPFGVDHGDVSKGYKKALPKLSRVRLYKDTKTKDHDTMNSKLRRHSNAARLIAGGTGGGLSAGLRNGKTFADPEMARRLKRAKENKRGAQGMYDAIGRMNRQTRTLP